MKIAPSKTFSQSTCPINSCQSAGNCNIHLQYSEKLHICPPPHPRGDFGHLTFIFKKKIIRNSYFLSKTKDENRHLDFICLAWGLILKRNLLKQCFAIFLVIFPMLLLALSWTIHHAFAPCARFQSNRLITFVANSTTWIKFWHVSTWSHFSHLPRILSNLWSILENSIQIFTIICQ